MISRLTGFTELVGKDTFHPVGETCISVRVNYIYSYANTWEKWCEHGFNGYRSLNFDKVLQVINIVAKVAGNFDININQWCLLVVNPGSLTYAVFRLQKLVISDWRWIYALDESP